MGVGIGQLRAGFATQESRRTSPSQQTRSMSRLVFTYAWHLARSQNAAARLLLGMSAHCARLIAVCTLRQIHDLAEAHPEWLQPRWASASRLLAGATDERQCRRRDGDGSGAHARSAAHGCRAACTDEHLEETTSRLLHSGFTPCVPQPRAPGSGCDAASVVTMPITEG